MKVRLRQVTLWLACGLLATSGCAGQGTPATVSTAANTTIADNTTDNTADNTTTVATAVTTSTAMDSTDDGNQDLTTVPSNPHLRGGSAEPPVVLTAATAGGDGVVRARLSQSTVTQIESWPSQGSAVSVLQVSDDGADILVVSTCCEPAAGTVYQLNTDTGVWVEHSYGKAVDHYETPDGAPAVLLVDPNGGFVVVDDTWVTPDSGFATRRIVADPGYSGMPIDAAAFPDGRIGIITYDATYALHVVEADIDSFGKDTIWVDGDDLGGELAAPFVDETGAVHLIAEQSGQQLLVTVTASGEWTTQPGSGARIVDQDSDSTGRYVVVAYQDGTVSWYQNGDPTQTFLNLPAIDKVEW